MGRIEVMALLVTAGLAFATAAPAFGQDSFRLRGVLSAIEDGRLIISTPDDEVHEYPLSRDVRFFVVRPATLDDVEAGAFVGVTSVEQGGGRVALETHVFAEELRGIGEGHHPWDLVEQANTMTNATVAEVEATGPDRQVTLTYVEGTEANKTTGSQTITLPPDAPLVHLAKAGPADVPEPGQAVFVWVEVPADGTPVATLVVVGKDGAVPPM